MIETFSTRDEAIERQIIEVLEAGGAVTDAHAEFDIDAIADEVLGDYEDGYASRVDSDEFWEVVDKYRLEREED